MHMAEMNRTLKPNTQALVAAPSSFGVIFTDGRRTQEEVVADLEEILANAQQGEFPHEITAFDEIYRATFAKRNGRWVIILDENELISGEEIWRKIPKLIVPNYYHGSEDYFSAFEKNGFEIKEFINSKFASKDAREAYNQQHKSSLGSAYERASPFVIFIIEKRN